jgi:hypothetical protein
MLWCISLLITVVVQQASANIIRRVTSCYPATARAIGRKLRVISYHCPGVKTHHQSSKLEPHKRDAAKVSLHIIKHSAWKQSGGLTRWRVCRLRQMSKLAAGQVDRKEQLVTVGSSAFYRDYEVGGNPKSQSTSKLLKLTVTSYIPSAMQVRNSYKADQGDYRGVARVITNKYRSKRELSCCARAANCHG